MPRSTDRPKIAAVLLAAGASRRLGQPKQLVRHQGVPLVRRAAEAALAAGCGTVWVVVPPKTPATTKLAQAISDAVDGLAVQPIENPDWEEGISSSIRAGVRAARSLGPAAPRALLLMVADQPELTAEPLRRLIAAFEATDPGARIPNPGRLVACSYGGVAGVPAIFPQGYWEALEALQGDVGARQIVRTAANHCIHVSWPEGAVDLDRPEDLEFTDL